MKDESWYEHHNHFPKEPEEITQEDFYKFYYFLYCLRQHKTRQITESRDGKCYLTASLYELDYTIGDDSVYQSKLGIMITTDYYKEFRYWRYGGKFGLDTDYCIINW